MAPMRQVRGSLFVDYVRMLRARKGVEWSELRPEDVAFLHETIEPNAWYPMASFERMGNAILRVIAHDQMPLVHLWGRQQAGQLYAANRELLAAGDPVETLNRFKVLRETFFDFDALEILMLHDDEAQIAIHYYMGDPAEEAASFQTMGFFESLLQLAGAKDVASAFRQRSWAGDPRTRLDLSWTSPPGR
jgi:hypothetical protein